MIHWGDGTSSTGHITGIHSVAGEPGSVAVEGSHVYGQPGGFGISISVTDDQTGVLYEGGWHTAAMISEPKLVPIRLAAHAHTVSTVRGHRRREAVAMLTTNATPAMLRASISWGDGAVSDGTIGGVPSSLHVTGWHRWRRAGRYAVTVTVTGPKGRVLAVTVGRAIVHAR